jgi:Ran-binding protein 1
MCLIFYRCYVYSSFSCFRRGKLYVYGETLLDKGTGNKTWKERGVGEFKLLKHREHGRIRALMRQEKTMKIIVNHFVDPRIVLTPNVGNDKSWVWVAFDFSESELVETVSDSFLCCFLDFLLFSLL